MAPEERKTEECLEKRRMKGYSNNRRGTGSALPRGMRRKPPGIPMRRIPQPDDRSAPQPRELLSMKFSVISAVFRAESTIAACVRSVTEQKHADFEQILIDNCSPDRTLETALAVNPSLRIVSEPDRGIYDAMNKGAALASGEILSWLNADDRYLPGTFEAVEHYFSDHPETELLHGDILVEQRILRPPAGPASFGGFRVYHPAVFLRREVWERCGPFDLAFPICADLDFFLRAGRCGIRFRHLDRALTRFALGGVSTRRRKQTAGEIRRILIRNGRSALFADSWYAAMRLRALCAEGKRRLLR